MTFDIPTLACVSGLIFLAQVIAVTVQFVINRTSRGVSWWLAGSTVWALGVIFTPLVAIKSLIGLAVIANPLIVLGSLLLYVGLLRFLEVHEPPWLVIAIFLGTSLAYYYFMFVDNAISARSLVLAAAFTLAALMAAARLFINRDRSIAGSANFTALVFGTYGGFSAARMMVILLSPPIQSYADQQLMLELAYLVPIVCSLLWTFGFILMVNQRLNAENREEKEKLRLIFNTTPDAALISRLADGLIVDVNASSVTLSGYTRAELIGATTAGLPIWTQTADRDQFMAELRTRGACENLEYVLRRKDGQKLIGRLSARIINIQGAPHVLSVVHDITASQQAAAALRESEALYRSILNASPDDITITDLQGRILVTSPAAKSMFGYAADDDQVAVGSALLDYILPADRERARANLQNLVVGAHTGPNEYRGVRQDGSLFDIEVNTGLIPGADQQPAKMVFIVRDITGRKQAEQHIQQLMQQLEVEKQAAQRNANTDSLTGLANRRYFDAVLGAEFHRSRRSGRPLSLIMLDVDRFKKFNDHYGHLAGDACLRQIGATLRAWVGRVSDLPARYGGEEFVVLLSETDQPGAAMLAERLRAAVEALAIPHAGSDIAPGVTVSLGVVTIGAAQLAAPEQVVALADTALYAAKRGGRNRVAVATDSALREPAAELVG